MLGPIIRVLTIAIAIAVALNSHVIWEWRIAIFLGVMFALDRLIAGYCALR